MNYELFVVPLHAKIERVNKIDKGLINKKQKKVL